MKSFARPAPLVLLLAWVALFLVGQSILACIALVAWVAVLALSSLRQTAEMRAEETAEELDPESRTLFAPIKRLTAEIEEIVGQNGDSPVIRTVGEEAQAEARKIREQMVRALTIRGELKRAMRGQSLAERETTELAERVRSAGIEQERASLETALTARRQEMDHYVEVQANLHRIDGAVEQARAALSEMKTRLSVGVSSARMEASTSPDELRESLSTLRALSASYEEAVETFRE